MVKIVYPDSKRRTFTPNEPWTTLVKTKSLWPDGRIIADDNLLEGL